MRELRVHGGDVKAEAVKMVLELGLTRREVAKRLSIPAGSIGNRIGVARRTSSAPGAPTVGELAAENARLCKELAEARMDVVFPVILGHSGCSLPPKLGRCSISQG